MTGERQEPVFSGLYRDTGYIFGNSAYTCCHNCTRKDKCPLDTTGVKCTREQRTCKSCTLWNTHGCRHFVLDWRILEI